MQCFFFVCMLCSVARKYLHYKSTHSFGLSNRIDPIDRSNGPAKQAVAADPMDHIEWRPSVEN